MRVFDVNEYNDKVWKALQDLARRPDLIMKALEGSGEKHSDKMKIYQEKLAQIEHKILEFESYKANAVSLRVRNKISEEEFTKQVEFLEQEFNDLIKQKKELGFKIEYLKRQSMGVIEDDVLRYAKFMHQSGNKLDLVQKRQTLESFVTRIPIYSNGEFELVCKFPISEPGEELQVEQYQVATSVQSGGAAAQ